MYYTAARINNEIIDEFKSMAEAKKAIRDYLVEDRELSEKIVTIKYDPNYYCILDKNKNEIEQYTAAAMIGRKGGSKTSPAKKKSSRENGKKGGRPRTKK